MMLLNDALPALPGHMLTGPAGFSDVSSAQCLTGSSPLLCAPEVLSAWVVFLALTIWLGGLVFQTFIVERAALRDSTLVPTALATRARFYRIAVVALVAFLIANITYFMGLLMIQGGSGASGFSLTLWWDALRSGSFGVFWLLRELLALLTLLLILFPQRSVAGEAWRPLLKLRWVELALAGLLLAALALSEPTTVAQGKGTVSALAVPVDWLFLLALSLWVGGLLSIVLILFPAIWRCEAAERGRIVATVLPRYFALALVSAVVAALSAAFNAYAQLTSWGQFTGTPYGRTLVVGMLLFIFMLCIDVYRAAWLRPALSRELDNWDRMQSEPDSDTIVASRVEKQETLQDARTDERVSASESAASEALRRMNALHAGFHNWIQYEALLGGIVLLCVALLGGLVGSLAPTLPGSNGPTLTATTKTPVHITQTAGNLTVTLKVTPDTFGTNTFGVLLVNAATGQPIDGGSVHLAISMLDMDMGTATSDLKGVGNGFYVGQGDLLMNGHWQVQVQAQVPQDSTTHQFTFVFSVSLS